MSNVTLQTTASPGAKGGTEYQFAPLEGEGATNPEHVQGELDERMFISKAKDGSYYAFLKPDATPVFHKGTNLSKHGWDAQDCIDLGLLKITKS